MTWSFIVRGPLTSLEKVAKTVAVDLAVERLSLGPLSQVWSTAWYWLR